MNATITRGVATVTILNDDVPPPPEPGEVNVIPAGGGGQCVAVKNGGGWEPLEAGEQINVDDVLYVNPRGSRVIVQSIAGVTTFYGGRFDIAEFGADGDKPIVVLRLVGGNFKANARRGSHDSRLERPGEEGSRPATLGQGKGRFRTRGRYSSGTVRGRMDHDGLLRRHGYARRRGHRSRVRPRSEEVGPARGGRELLREGRQDQRGAMRGRRARRLRARPPSRRA